MVDPLILVTSIRSFVTWGFKIKSALVKAKHNAEDCRRIGGLLHTLNGLTNYLEKEGSTTRDTTKGLEEALGHAAEIVKKCLSKNSASSVFNANKIADELLRVCFDILLNLGAVLLANLVDVKRAVNSMWTQNHSMLAQILKMLSANPNVPIQRQKTYWNTTGDANHQNENKRETKKTDLARPEFKTAKGNAPVDNKVPCASLSDRNGDLGSKFYGTLPKTTPTKEELKLKGYNGDISKLDPARRILKDVQDTMLYRAKFVTEVNYLKKFFRTLEAACIDLRSRLFVNLLDAVLNTMNRMNHGTNGGGARAFKLDTLLKLADIKLTDGKTTVLHFVVQEVMRSIGFYQTAAVNPGSTSKEQFKKDGLIVLAGLSIELPNVKSAANLEVDTLLGRVSRLETGLEKVKLVSQLKQTCPQVSGEKFFETIDVFFGQAQAAIETVNAARESALQRVQETMEYFYGDAIKEEPHPRRIFMVVSDFLEMLDRECRDAGKTPERVMMGSGKSFRVSAGTSLQRAVEGAQLL